ncbi:hypothetical protein TrLO_g5325 [Triparma laevis f. longispina]|uniref:Uncharacterized protein n=1 Tax=Triparma laevis f. longispina TaxID=1714387 RepID=A0A9W7KYS7_9STRA|nr:hypothetical protein TrLO_g5325 [Triparma laevis f. longispina]
MEGGEGEEESGAMVEVKQEDAAVDEEGVNEQEIRQQIKIEIKAEEIRGEEESGAIVEVKQEESRHAFGNDDLRMSVKEWCEDSSAAEAKYGHISGGILRR